MMFLDTNVVLWLAGKSHRKISRKAIQAIEAHKMLYSPMVRLEIEYLYEIGRIKQPVAVVLENLCHSIEVQESQSNFQEICNKACTIGWTRDVFDRLIVAEAMVHQASLVTGDEHLLAHYKRAVW